MLALTACGSPFAVRQAPPGSGLAARVAASDVPQPPSEWIPSPHFDSRPEGERIDTVVWHHTSSRADARRIAQYFQNPAAKVSSHYIVDRTGYIVRCVPDDKRSWHAGKSTFHGKPNVNGFSIGIEIANVGDNQDPYPNAQVEAIIHLTAWLCRTYDVPLERITRHRDVAIPAGRKNDTSDNYPLAYATGGVRAVLAGEPLPPRPEPASPPGYDPTWRFYTTQPGDTWDGIADAVLDNPVRGFEIREANPHVKVLRPGQQLRIPTDFDAFFRRFPAGIGLFAPALRG
ncbi:MAG: N-acetylmuramoyl-L-alanine amidase [Candidatus Sericytochromatia bacterium]|nr:N-acetylmuramoyl-L-alanine amidase [Candidatus Tanganyikabacteria bacterium]